jgi:hypothetical protein
MAREEDISQLPIIGMGGRLEPAAATRQRPNASSALAATPGASHRVLTGQALVIGVA